MENFKNFISGFLSEFSDLESAKAYLGKVDFRLVERNVDVEHPEFLLTVFYDYEPCVLSVEVVFRKLGSSCQIGYRFLGDVNTGYLDKFFDVDCDELKHFGLEFLE